MMEATLEVCLWCTLVEFVKNSPKHCTLQHLEMNLWYIIQICFSMQFTTVNEKKIKKKQIKMKKRRGGVAFRGRY